MKIVTSIVLWTVLFVSSFIFVLQAEYAAMPSYDDKGVTWIVICAIAAIVWYLCARALMREVEQTREREREQLRENAYKVKRTFVTLGDDGELIDIE